MFSRNDYFCSAEDVTLIVGDVLKLWRLHNNQPPPPVSVIADQRWEAVFIPRHKRTMAGNLIKHAQSRILDGLREGAKCVLNEHIRLLVLTSLFPKDYWLGLSVQVAARLYPVNIRLLDYCVVNPKCGVGVVLVRLLVNKTYPHDWHSNPLLGFVAFWSVFTPC